MLTRYERIMRLLWGSQGPAPDIEGDDVVRRILAIADERSFWGCREIEQYTGRSKTTVQSWYRRGAQDFPSPHQKLGMGPIWDTEQIKLWALEHPHLVAEDKRA
jgi:predicted DNA-binding transcriptional regulator AlpA